MRFKYWSVPSTGVTLSSGAVTLPSTGDSALLSLSVLAVTVTFVGQLMLLPGIVQIEVRVDRDLGGLSFGLANESCSHSAASAPRAWGRHADRVDVRRHVTGNPGRFRSGGYQMLRGGSWIEAGH